MESINKFNNLLFKKLESEGFTPKWVENHGIKIENKNISIVFEDESFNWKVDGVLITWSFNGTYREITLINFTIDELINKIKLIILW